MMVEIEKATQQWKDNNEPKPLLIRPIFVGVVKAKHLKNEDYRKQTKHQFMIKVNGLNIVESLGMEMPVLDGTGLGMFDCSIEN